MTHSEHLLALRQMLPLILEALESQFFEPYKRDLLLIKTRQLSKGYRLGRKFAQISLKMLKGWRVRRKPWSFLIPELVLYAFNNI